jgi:pSer/pThr/pTyr-binding forkhead associated (FHA) protein
MPSAYFGARAGGFAPNGAIVGLSGMYKDASFPVGGGEEIIIGRDAAVSHIVIDQNAEKISRRHCGITFDPGSGMYRVTDYSSNGTFQEDGTRMLTNVPTTLPRGAIVSLGSRQTSFRLN